MSQPCNEREFGQGWEGGEEGSESRRGAGEGGEMVIVGTILREGGPSGKQRAVDQSIPTTPDRDQSAL